MAEVPNTPPNITRFSNTWRSRLCVASLQMTRKKQTRWNGDNKQCHMGIAHLHNLMDRGTQQVGGRAALRGLPPRRRLPDGTHAAVDAATCFVADDGHALAARHLGGLQRAIGLVPPPVLPLLHPLVPSCSVCSCPRNLAFTGDAFCPRDTTESPCSCKQLRSDERAEDRGEGTAPHRLHVAPSTARLCCPASAPARVRVSSPSPRRAP
jgi:hypothetical protein